MAAAASTCRRARSFRWLIFRMDSGTSTNPPGSIPRSPPGGRAGQFVCPYCGSVNDVDEGPCPSCTMENSAAGRKATKGRIGPWYVLQKRNPAAPGMKFETLLSFVHRGRIKPHSIVRGPTTHQLWRFAAQVKGLSRQFGLCYSCGSSLATDAAVCPQCNRPQGLPAQPDVFLESADGEPAPEMREVTPAASEVAAPSAVDSPQPATPHAADALHADPHHESSNGEHDIIIPSLGEAELPTPDLPPGPRERLSSFRRERAGFSQRIDPLYEEDAPEDDSDDSYSPSPVGPAFVAPARPMRPAPRRRMWIEAVVFLIVLGAAAVSGLFYVDPHLEAQTQSWLDRGLRIVGISAGSKPSDAQPAPSPDGTSPSQQIPPAAPLPFIPPALPPAPQPSPTVSAPAPSPAPAPSTAAPTSPPITQVDPAPATPDVPSAADPAPSDESSSSTDNGGDDPFTRSRTLRNRAIDAENSGNYAEAVSLFEQIKQLPREAWPGDLELRLKAARANLEGQPRQ